MGTAQNGVCIGQYQAAMLVATRLDGDCTPLTGDEDQARTRCFTTLTASPQYDEGQQFGRPAADGRRCWFVRDCDHLTQWNVSMSIQTWDMEQLELMTGSELAIGKAGGPWDGEVIGIYTPGPDAECPGAFSLELYMKAAPAGSTGVCAEAGAGFPTYGRHLWPWVRARFGDITFDDNTDGTLIAIEGFALPNPNWGTGPANNWEGEGGVPADTPYAHVFSNTLPSHTCGYAATVA